LRVNLYMQYAHGTYSCALLDSPATTSSVTYKTQMSTGNASYTIQAQHAFIRTSTIILMEVAA
jgi:acyl-coenzyme A thioesterase PaaI-like protein